MEIVKILFLSLLISTGLMSCNFKLGSSSEEKLEVVDPLNPEPSQIADEYHLTEVKGVAYCAQLSSDENDVRCVEADLDSVPYPFSEFITSPIRFLYHLSSGEGFIAPPGSKTGLSVIINDYSQKTFSYLLELDAFAFWRNINNSQCAANEIYAWEGQAHPGLAGGIVDGYKITGRMSLEIFGLYEYSSNCKKQFEEVKECLTDINNCPSDASNTQEDYYNYAENWLAPWLNSGALTLEEIPDHKLLGFSLLYE